MSLSRSRFMGSRCWVKVKANMADVAAVKKLKVAELRELLTAKGLNAKGNKQELVDRLTEHLEQNEGDAALENEAEAENRAPNEAITTEEAGLLDPELEAITTIEEDADILEPESKDEVVEEKKSDPGPPKLTPITQPQDTAKSTATPAQTLTEQEKKKIRAERFSTPLSEDAKKAARAQRFGTTVTAKATAKSGGLISSIPQGASAADVDKLKKRAERFGAVVSPVVAKSEQQARLLKRKERFGSSTTSVTSSSEIDAKKKKRAERFGL